MEKQNCYQLNKQTHSSPGYSSSEPSTVKQLNSLAAHSKKSTAPDVLTRIFNTAIICSQEQEKTDFSAQLAELTQSAPFKVLLSAIKQLALVQTVSEQQAAENLIQTFKKLDKIWNHYLVQETLGQIRKRTTQ